MGKLKDWWGTLEPRQQKFVIIGIAGLVARTGQTVAIADAYEDPRFSHDVDRVAIKLETFIEEFSNILQRSLGGANSSASGH